jgi:lysophospholipase L1-like esterase
MNRLLLAIVLLSFSFCTPEKAVESKPEVVVEKNPDWPNLNRFKEANADVDMKTNPKNRVVFMGNSITEGWLKQKESFFYTKPYINRGISGQTTPQMLIRFNQDVIDLKPAAVVILAGINDIAGNTGPSTIEMIADNIESMAHLANANDIKVVISSVLPADDFPWRPGLEPAPKVKALNKLLSSFANENGFAYLNYYDSMSTSEGAMQEHLTNDGVHVTPEGYVLMQSLAEEVIDRVLTQ